MQRIQQGDLVQVISGKEKGKKGHILKIVGNKQRVVIKGFMMHKRHLKPSQQNPKGSIIEREGSIHISNVMLVDPSSDRPTRVSYGSDAQGKVRLGKSRSPIVKKSGTRSDA